MANPVALNLDAINAPIVGVLEQWEPGAQEPHQHKRHQLLSVSSGVMHITTALGTWVLPSSRAIWISADTEHSIMVRRPTQLYVLYIDPAAYELPKDSYCWVLEMAPLLRELIKNCTNFHSDYPCNSPEARLAHVLIDQIVTRDHSPVDLPLPRDHRALKIVDMLQADPSNKAPLTALASQVGASSRTIERIFKEESGISFGSWRQRLRLLRAMEQLAYGESVNHIAAEIGYESPSSFITAFKQLFGDTPARYFK